MPKKKHPSEMTNRELAEYVFHPEVLKHAKEHIERINAEPAKTKRTKNK
jgi:hypothetical protein